METMGAVMAASVRVAVGELEGRAPDGAGRGVRWRGMDNSLQRLVVKERSWREAAE